MIWFTSCKIYQNIQKQMYKLSAQLINSVTEKCELSFAVCLFARMDCQRNWFCFYLLLLLMLQVKQEGGLWLVNRARGHSFTFRTDDDISGPTRDQQASAEHGGSAGQADAAAGRFRGMQVSDNLHYTLQSTIQAWLHPGSVAFLLFCESWLQTCMHMCTYM